MLFNSWAFLCGLLPLTVLSFYWAAHLRDRLAPAASPPGVWVLLAASLFFYAYWDVRYLALLLGSVIINRGWGLLLQRTGSGVWLFWGVAFNLAVIGLFKYADFCLKTHAALRGTHPELLELALPLGISFFTFQQVAYLIESRRRQVEDHGLVNYALFVTFFPQLIAGPIVRFGELAGQFRSRTFGQLDWTSLSGGALWFTIGLSKKVLLADSLAPFVHPVFSKAEWQIPVSCVEAWVAALAYTFQIYFDFSGYSDMAIGIGLMLGLSLPINFNSPYKAQSIGDFWRRWHITLSRFLRDYLYIPLGGNRHGSGRRYLNLAVVMLLGGLWHGAGWTFLVWGGVHGALLACSHALSRVRQTPALRGHQTPLLNTLVTFLLVVCAWVVFRADSLGSAGAMLSSLFGIAGAGMSGAPQTLAEDAALLRQALWILVPSAAMVWGLPNSQAVVRAVQAASKPAPAWRRAGVAGLAMAMCLFVILAGAPSEFLYFQF